MSLRDGIPEYKVPKDSEGYIKSFDISEEKEFTSFFEEFGFVVIRDVISEEECKRSIDEIWDYIEKGEFRRPSTLKNFQFEVNIPISLPKRNDISTWDTNWPSMAEEGIVGTPPAFKRQLVLNRQNPKIYKTFSTLMKEKELIVNHDRVGLFRPTNTPGEERKRWETTRNLHFDLNPWRFYGDASEYKDLEEKISSRMSNLTYNHLNHFIEENNELGPSNNKVHLQGVLNFFPNKAEDGGFQLVPGFSKHSREWTQNTKKTLGLRYLAAQTFIVLPDSSSLHNQSIRITMRPGSLVVWNQTVAHGSRPNHSSNPRYCQFIKMHIASSFYKESEGKRELNERCLYRCERLKYEFERNKEFDESDLTELGRKLFGFETW